MLNPSPPTEKEKGSRAFDVAVAELAGMIVVPSEDVRREITATPGLQKIYHRERLEAEKWIALEAALKETHSLVA